MNVERRIRDVFDRLYSRRLEISLARGDAPKFKKIVKGIDALEAAADRICQPLQPDTPPVVLSTPERVASLTEALVAIAIDKGAALLPRDRLKSLIVAAVDGQAKVFWHNESDGQPIGFIRSSQSFRDGLKARGVLVWIRDLDMMVRLVNVNWLHSHQDIYEYVNGEGEPGHTCRFCRIVEPPESTNLIRVRPEANDGIRTHAECTEYWLRWEGITAQYTTLDEAIAADQAANRKAGDSLPIPESLPVDSTVEPGLGKEQLA